MSESDGMDELDEFRMAHEADRLLMESQHEERMRAQATLAAQNEVLVTQHWLRHLGALERIAAALEKLAGIDG